jgi:hypothetical protein
VGKKGWMNIYPKVSYLSGFDENRVREVLKEYVATIKKQVWEQDIILDGLVYLYNHKGNIEAMTIGTDTWYIKNAINDISLIEDIAENLNLQKQIVLNIVISFKEAIRQFALDGNVINLTARGGNESFLEFKLENNIVVATPPHRKFTTGYVAPWSLGNGKV